MTFDGESASLGRLAGRLTLIAGSTFCISSRTGDMRGSRPHGLFVEDTRVLSGLDLRVDGDHPEILVPFTEGMRTASVVGRVRRRDEPGSTLVIRRRTLQPTFRETITLRNLSRSPSRSVVEVRLDADFATVFEVKEQRRRRRAATQVSASHSEISFASATGDARTFVRFDREGDVEGATARFVAEIEPKGEWVLEMEVNASTGSGSAAPPLASLARTSESDATAWVADTPRIAGDDHRVVSSFRNAIADLSVLRILDERYGDRPVLAAGVPWFMTLFGRDSILASWMALIVDPALAVSTVQVLAQLQGEDEDDVTEEQPGRIVHEVRFGRSALLGPGRSERYYGTADATPLFVFLVGELARWGVARETIEPMMPHVDRALGWIRRWGDEDGDGYVEYRRRSELGLSNQGWKDSHDAISFADGRLAEGPIALCEVQGYVFSALLARADLAELFGDEATATTCRSDAVALRERFDRDFWLEERGWYALALDGDKRPVDALASNIGHALWSGIVSDEHAPAVASRLTSRDLFTGWGVRTLARSMERYDPLSYHDGSVWPHDTAIAIAGLSRYGFVEEAVTVLEGLLDLVPHYDHLPELFAGLAREEVAAPVDYPASSAPQAWAAAAPLLALRAMLRLEPLIPLGRVHVAPIPLPALTRLAIRGIDLGLGGRVDLELDGDGIALRGLASGIELVHEPRRRDVGVGTGNLGT